MRGVSTTNARSTVLEGARTNDPGDIIYNFRAAGAAATQFRHAAHKGCRATFEGAMQRMAEFLCQFPEAKGTLLRVRWELDEDRTNTHHTG